MEELNNILSEKTTYQEMIDEGFDLPNNSGSEEGSSESDCSDDDVAGTKNSIFLDRRVISMFLDTRPSTLDIVCRFLFPFCYLCFASYWWLHYIGKRNSQVESGCQKIFVEDDETLIECSSQTESHPTI